MAQVPTRTTFWLGDSFASAKNVTAVTNAVEAVLTSAAHGLQVKDVIELRSEWGTFDKRVFEVKEVLTADTFTIGQDTTNEQLFPPTGGEGSFRKVNSFTQITQVLDATSSGGDPQNVEYKYIESPIRNSINDGFASTSLQLTVDADSVDTAGYLLMRKQTQTQQDTVLKMLLPKGSRVYQPCTVALNEAIQLQDGQINRVVAAFNGNNILTRV